MAQLIELEELVSAETAASIVKELASAPFEDGRATAQGVARAVKNNEQLDPNHELSRRLGHPLLGALSQSDVFKAAAVPRTILPLRFCRYKPGMAYGDHLDIPVIATPSGPLRTDLSLTVWLSAPESYDGGELVLQTENGERVIKGQAGDAVLYSSATLHRVNPITRGERVVAISWLQSLVADESQRQLLFDLARISTTIANTPELAATATQLHHLQHRLLRMWVSC